MLTSILAVPLLGGFAAWLLGRYRDSVARWIALATALLDLALALSLVSRHGDAARSAARGAWLAETQIEWIPRLGVSFHLGVDGLSLVLVVLTALMGVVAVLASWREIHRRVALFQAAVLWTQAGILGVFMSLDLFLFYFFWELMLVPMYFVIGIWGHERRIYAAIKFFIFTFAGGLLMLITILVLYTQHGRLTGLYTFDYSQILGTAFAPQAAMWLFLGFLVSFAVKLPALPLHTWLPDAHTEAPTAGSVILAALLLKTGAYGLIRFAIPFFPQAAASFAPYGMAIGAAGVLYGALLSFGQRDLKRLVAYTSVSHMGFVLLGIFVWSGIALQGVVLQMVCHAFSTGALFVVVGLLQERLGTRDMAKMGGFWPLVPRLSALTLVFALASLGLPGLGNFVAEFLILVAAFRANVLLTVIAAAGMVLSTIYALWLVQRVFHGPVPDLRLPDLSAREWITLGALAALLIWIGIYPQPLLDMVSPALTALRVGVTGSLTTAGLIGGPQ